MYYSLSLVEGYSTEKKNIKNIKNIKKDIPVLWYIMSLVSS